MPLQGRPRGPGPPCAARGSARPSRLRQDGFWGPKPVGAAHSPHFPGKTRGPRGWSGASGRAVLLSWRAAAAGARKSRGCRSIREAPLKPNQMGQGSATVNRVRASRRAGEGGLLRDPHREWPFGGRGYGRDRVSPSLLLTPTVPSTPDLAMRRSKTIPSTHPACVYKAPTMRWSASLPG